VSFKVSLILVCIRLINSVFYTILASAIVSRPKSSFALRYAFYFTAFLIDFALLPNRNVESVSRSLYALNEQVMTRHV